MLPPVNAEDENDPHHDILISQVAEESIVRLVISMENSCKNKQEEISETYGNGEVYKYDKNQDDDTVPNFSSSFEDVEKDNDVALDDTIIINNPKNENQTGYEYDDFPVYLSIAEINQLTK